MADVDRLTIPIRCSGNSPTGLLANTHFSIAALTAANLTAQQSAANALKIAVNALTSGVAVKYSIAVETSADKTYPTAIANRGQKWIITAANAAGQVFTYTIAAADPTGNVGTDNRVALLTSADWVAFIAAFNAVAVDRAGGALTFVGAVLGGRRR